MICPTCTRNRLGTATDQLYGDEVTAQRAAQAGMSQCDSCGASLAATDPLSKLTLCASCARQYRVVYKAEPDLMRLLFPLIQRWARHWRQQGLSEQELHEVLEGLASWAFIQPDKEQHDRNAQTQDTPL